VSKLPDIIRSERLALRPFTATDAQALFDYSGDPDWGRFQALADPYDRAAAERFLDDLLLRDRAVWPSWAVTLRGEVSGIVNLRFEQDDRVAVLGYGIHKRLWGRGFASEAAAAVVTKAFFSCRRLRRVRAHTDARNEASIGVLEKLGFTREGTLRANQFHHGEFADEAVFGVLREEWEQGGRTAPR
jgi:RimJ/RimL family protein N-acetyltransferase